MVGIRVRGVVDERVVTRGVEEDAISIRVRGVVDERVVGARIGD